MTGSSMTQSAAKVPTREQWLGATPKLLDASYAANREDFEEADNFLCEGLSILGLHVSAQPAAQQPSDLVKRLRGLKHPVTYDWFLTLEQAADRIEALEADQKSLRLHIADLTTELDINVAALEAAAAQPREAALEAENASLATVWFEIVKCCEELEDEAEQKITPDNPNAHDTGFWRGQKHATKVIRHSASKALAVKDERPPHPSEICQHGVYTKDGDVEMCCEPLPCPHHPVPAKDERREETGQ